MNPLITRFPFFDFNPQQLDKRTKASLENLRRSMRSRSDSQDDLRDVLVTCARELRREERLAGLNPIQRILNDPWQRIYINAIVRKVASAAGHLVGLDEEQSECLRAIGEDSTPGSAYISDKVAPEWYDLLYENGAWKTLGVLRMASKVLRFATLTARPKAVFLNIEAGTLSDDANSTGVEPSGDAETIATLLNISEQWLTDTKLDLSAAFLENFERAFNERLEYAAFSGNGVADGDNGGMTGIFAHADPTLVIAASGNVSVQTLDRDDLVSTVAAAAPAALQRRPRWWCHPALIAPLMRVNDSSGAPVLRVSFIEDENADTVFSLLGFPLTLTPGAPSTNAVSSKVLAFGDGRAMGIGIREEFALQSSPHAGWANLRRAFRGLGRATAVMRRGAGFAILRTAAA